MKAGRTIRANGLRSLVVLALASLPAPCQTGVTFISPKAGEVYYAGYEGDSIASWDTIILEWTYDDTSGPRLSSNTTVLEISPDDGLNWVTFKAGNGTKVKITSSRYLCRIDTFGYDIQSASDPGRSLISETCVVRVYDYVNHSFGGVSGVFAVRMGPPPSGVIRGARNASRPRSDPSSRTHGALTISVPGDGLNDGIACSVDGRTLVVWHGRAPGSRFLRVPAGILAAATGGNGRSIPRSAHAD